MKFIVRGYAGVAKDAECKIIYAGNDGTAAEAALLTPEPGILRKDILKYPVATRTRHFAPSEVAELPAVEEVAEPNLELLPEPEPVAKKKAKGAADLED